MRFLAKKCENIAKSRQKMIPVSFLFLHENLCCGYSLEAPRRGASNEYPQHKFSWRNKKNIMWIPPLICSYGESSNLADDLVDFNVKPYFLDKTADSTDGDGCIVRCNREKHCKFHI